MPDDRAYVAVLCNSDSPAAPPAYLAKRLGAIAIGSPFSEQKAVTVDPKVLQGYAGVYAAEKGPRRTVTFEDGKLFVQPAGGAKAEIKPRSNVEFFVENRLPVVQVRNRRRREGDGAGGVPGGGRHARAGDRARPTLPRRARSSRRSR